MTETKERVRVDNETIAWKIRTLRKEYEKLAIAAKKAKYDAMNEIIGILKDSDKPLTARQISESMTKYAMTPSEIGINLYYLYNNESQLATFCCNGNTTQKPATYFNKTMPKLHISKPSDIKHKDYKTVRIAEIDDNGNIIPNTEQTIDIHQKSYWIE